MSLELGQLTELEDLDGDGGTDTLSGYNLGGEDRSDVGNNHQDHDNNYGLQCCLSLPDRPLPLRLRVSKELTLKIVSGKEPVIMLLSRCRDSRDGGMIPVKLLLFRKSFLSCGNDPSQNGTSPTKLLLPKFKSFNLRNFDRPPGIWPVKWLSLMSSEVRNVRFPRLGEMIPDRPRPERCTAATLCLPLHTTPVQRQVEVAVDQFLANMFSGSEVMSFLN
nr:hypothetical protein F511_45136 [Ipomoea batatas]